MKINLGCGGKRMEGYMNVDIVKTPSVDIVMDLSKKWKFKNESIEEIYMDNILEHLDFWKTMGEIRRVLKPGGICRIIVPHFKSPSAYMPQHNKYFSYKFFEIGFKERFNNLNGFKIERIKLIPPTKKLIFLSNMAPKLWEWFFPTSGIYVEFRKR